MDYNFRRGDVCVLNDEPPRPGTFVMHGSRPVIIVSDDKRNIRNGTCLVVPLTTKVHKAIYPGQFDIILNGNHSRVLCDQLRVVDKSSLGAPYAHISRKIEEALEDAIMDVLGFGGEDCVVMA